MKIQRCTTEENKITLLLETPDEEMNLFQGLADMSRYSDYPESYANRLANIRSQFRNTQKGLRGIDMDVDVTKFFLRLFFNETIEKGKDGDGFQHTLFDIPVQGTVPEQPAAQPETPKSAAAPLYPLTHRVTKFFASCGFSNNIADWLNKRNGVGDDIHGHCCFPIFDFDNQHISDEVYSLITDFKGLNGKQNGYGFTIRLGPENDDMPIYFFEGAIDLLSFMELETREWKERGITGRLVAMVGLKPSVVRRYAERYPSADLVLATNHGEQEDKFIEGIISSMKKAKVDVLLPPSTGNNVRSWNDLLLAATNSRERNTGYEK